MQVERSCLIELAEPKVENTEMIELEMIGWSHAWDQAAWLSLLSTHAWRWNPRTPVENPPICVAKYSNVKGEGGSVKFWNPNIFVTWETMQNFETLVNLFLGEK